MNMKRLLALTFFALLTCLPAQAQRPSETKNAERIFYSQRVPSVVRKQVPKGGETKFFGVWKSQNSKREILVHFYSSPTKEEPLLCKLDIFERVYKGKGNSVELINSIRLESDSNLFKYVTNNVPNTVVELTYGADVLWVNQKEKKIPLLRIHVLSSGGLHGDYGDYIVVNFPDSWSENANVQYFGWGGNINNSNSVDFNKVDARGYREIVTTYIQYADGNQAVTTQEFLWNGEEFSKSADADKEVD